jgi:hypothetical protein
LYFHFCTFLYSTLSQMRVLTSRLFMRTLFFKKPHKIQKSTIGYHKNYVKFTLFPLCKSQEGVVPSILYIKLIMASRFYRNFVNHEGPFVNKHLVKGTVYNEKEKWVETSINRSISINCLVGKCPFSAPNGHHHERCINVFSVLSTFF